MRVVLPVVILLLLCGCARPRDLGQPVPSKEWREKHGAAGGHAPRPLGEGNVVEIHAIGDLVGEDGKRWRTMDEAIARIQSQVVPSRWSEEGMAMEAQGKALVVRAPRSMQDAVGSFLEGERLQR